MSKKEKKELWVQPPPRMVRTFFVAGTPPKGAGHFAIEDPTAGGWKHVIVVPGEKRSTLLCPFTLSSWQVPNGCQELAHAKDVDCGPDRVVREVTDAWVSSTKLGLQRDFAVAALVLTLLGAEVPKVRAEPKAGEAPKTQGGKPVNEEALRPVDPESKRGQVAKFFLQPTPQSLHEAMARLGLTRSGVLSHLFCLSRDNGIGYTLANDCATLLIPDGFDLFAYVKPEKKAPEPRLGEDGQPRPEPKKRTSGKPVNVEALRPIPEPGKRAEVARLFVNGGQFYSLEVAQRKLELNRSAVLSHLFTINKENGLGYELSEDGSGARLIVPEGHTVFCAKQPRPKKEKTEC